MAVFTSGQYDDKLWEPIDLVVVVHTESVSMLRGIIAGIGGIIGGKSNTLDKKMNDLMDALKAKVKEAVKVNQMLVGLKFSLVSFGSAENTFISGTASGTLLKRKEVKAGGGTRRARR